jgi:hypothetical protein
MVQRIAAAQEGVTLNANDVPIVCMMYLVDVVKEKTAPKEK